MRVLQGERRMAVAYVRASVSRVVTVISLALGFCVTAESAPKYKVLHSFNGSDGSAPWAGVIVDSRGNVYGTTVAGGAGAGCGEEGCGAVFELAPSSKGEWSETVLYNFPFGNGDGSNVYGTLLLDGAGNLYGTTVSGGAVYSDCGGYCGTVYELTPTTSGWEEITLLEFNGSDGRAPYAGVVIDSTGNLYGTTPVGGPDYSGLVYELSPGFGGWNETVLYPFQPGAGGGTPFAGLILDASGSLYGTTYQEARAAATKAAVSCTN
jgi:hypothetical protein